MGIDLMKASDGGLCSNYIPLKLSWRKLQEEIEFQKQLYFDIKFKVSISIFLLGLKKI